MDENTVALAQLFAYYQQPLTISGTTMNWSYLTENPSIFGDLVWGQLKPGPGLPEDDPLVKREMVGKLFYSIHNSLKVAYYDTWSNHPGDYVFNGIISRKPYTSQANVENFVKNNFARNLPQNWDTDKVQISLDNLRPVLAYTITSTSYAVNIASYTFVVDGYLITGLPSSIFRNLYFHLGSNPVK